jgi:hypothetical protein
LHFGAQREILQRRPWIDGIEQNALLRLMQLFKKSHSCPLICLRRTKHITAAENKAIFQINDRNLVARTHTWGYSPNLGNDLARADECKPI